MRNPKWHRDEVILSLDLYYRLESGKMHSGDKEIIELSELLNKLPIHALRPDAQKFRNPNGIALKLGNFKFIDPDYGGTGLKGASKLDKEVFFEFYGKLSELKITAKKIKEAVNNEELLNELYAITDEKENDPVFVKEGQVVYKLHKLRERNNTINKKKKDLYFKKYGKLDCEVCGFDFNHFYGKLGKGYIEAHHRVPLSELTGESKTTLNDLALVCSNCHRMLHREINTLSINDLKNRISQSE